MKVKIVLVFIALFGMPFLVGADKLSGKVVNGYRVLEISEKQGVMDFTVYRGDYIKLDHGSEGFHFMIPTMNIHSNLPAGMEDAPYFKMKDTGTFDYSAGSVKGKIFVIEYQGSGYKLLSADETQAYIEKSDPLLLDVRTKEEFMQGHLEGASLLPVQELQARVGELEKYKNQGIMIYCATGNRSTVASKILIDHGFKSISNMRYGIKDWVQRKKPIVK